MTTKPQADEIAQAIELIRRPEGVQRAELTHRMGNRLYWGSEMLAVMPRDESLTIRKAYDCQLHYGIAHTVPEVTGTVPLDRLHQMVIALARGTQITASLAQDGQMHYRVTQF